LADDGCFGALWCCGGGVFSVTCTAGAFDGGFW
jgi:hypothetical protein